MLGIETLTGNAHAAALVGVVLLEAAVLYVGYGALENLAGSYLVDLLRGE